MFILCVYACICVAQMLLLFVCQVYNGSYDAPYVNPKAPVHFITGEPVSHSCFINFSNTSCVLYNVWSFSFMPCVHRVTVKVMTPSRALSTLGLL